MRRIAVVALCALGLSACGPNRGQIGTNTPSAQSTCGNGRLDDGEKCDPEIAEGPGACPTSCDDATPCTQDLLKGSAEACSAACEHVAVTACEGGDGCCPAGCNGTSDADCSTCADECPRTGNLRCDQNSVVTCGNFDGDACLEWGPATPCAGGRSCNAGKCEATCVSDCTSVGAKRCDETGAVVVCGDSDGHGCLKWGAASRCPATQVCSNGDCAATCSNECPNTGDRRCVAGSTTQFETCGNFDSDPCLEWGNALNCGTNLVCSNGSCASTCTDGCASAGTRQCQNNGVVSCGDFNHDGCLEWGTATSCASSETCTSGACQATPAPAKVLINEVVYDSAGSPDTEAFVELYGTAGASLTGYKLVGINGNGGAAYNEIALVGNLGPDGYFVVAHTGASAALKAQADQLDAKVDFQNGPDSIQIRWGTTVLDALGYGTFGASDVFAGEGHAAPAVAVGHSLGRNARHADTDDNSVDFKDRAIPTPGAANEATGATCGNGVVEAGETCDGNCPTTCNDANACTADALAGSAASCNAACTHQAITQCVAGDGCCAPGCNATTDTDCSASCGNGVVEPPEKCDGNCPTSCNDGNACTTDSMSGSAAQCSAACTNQAITQCLAGDGCCAPGCGPATDPDCSCVAESNAAFCTRLGKACGDVTGPDNCGKTRTAACGTCATGTCQNNACAACVSAGLTCATSSDCCTGVCEGPPMRCGPTALGEDCTSPFDLAFTNGHAHHSSTLVGRRADIASGCTGSAANSVDALYRYTLPPSTGEWTLRTRATGVGFVPQMGVASGSSCTNGSWFAASCSEGRGAQVFLDSPGTHLLTVDSSSRQLGPYDLDVSYYTPPANDDCSGASPLFAAGSATAAFSSDTTPASPYYPTGLPGGDLIYTFSSSQHARLLLDVKTPGWVPQVIVREYACPNASFPDRDHKFTGTAGSLHVDFPVQGDYWLLVGGAGVSDFGTFDLSASFGPPKADACGDERYLDLSSGSAVDTDTTFGLTYNKPTSCGPVDRFGNLVPTRDRVYSFTLASAKTVTATVTPFSPTDTPVVALESLCRVNSGMLDELACNSTPVFTQGTPGTQLSKALAAGTYWLWVANVSSGGYALSLSTSACVSETDAAFCSRVGKDCGKVGGYDNCGKPRTVASCGSCATGLTCTAASRCSGMVQVPAGTFSMGCHSAVDPDCDTDESPYHQVQVSAFEIDRSEVTQAAYKKCVDAAKCQAPTLDWSPSPSTKAEYPVVSTPWDQATAYCAWAGKRLPTEAEWEKAARGTDGRRYPWGNELPVCSLANDTDCGRATKPVESTWGDSPYGAKDMAGNVWEWVSDWYGMYSTSQSAVDPTGPATGPERVVRGAGFPNTSKYERVSQRYSRPPGYAGNAVGFRCAKSVP